MSNEEKNLALPAPERSTSSRAIDRYNTIYQANADSAESDAAATPLGHYLWMLRRHKWALLTFVVASVACTVGVSSRLTPIYEATATIDVDRMTPTGAVGQDATAVRNGGVADTDQFLSTQVELIKSDSVLRPVAEKLRMRPAETGRPAVATSRSDAAPVRFPNLRVTRPPKTYILQIAYRSPDPVFAAQVANEVANSYIAHTYDIRYKSTTEMTSYMNRQLEELRAKMERSDAALSEFEKELNVISPEEKTNIVSAHLLQLNTEYTTAQSERIAKEPIYDAAQSGSVEALEVSPQGEQLKLLSQHIQDEDEKFAVVKAQYGPNHPEYKKEASRVADLQRQFAAQKADAVRRITADYKAAKNREEMLQATRDQTKAELDDLNARSLQYAQLKSEAEDDRKLYSELTRRIQEAGINASFPNSSIRLSDPARPPLRPVFPRTTTNALLALLISLVIGVGAVFISEGLDHTLRDPEAIQRQLKTEILGSLPVVKAWRGHLPGEASGLRHRPLFGSIKGAANVYEEAVRTLRDSILLPNAANRPRSLLITSATPREGKTTTAVHLAVVHSQQKRRTLIIDGDLRRPGVYNHVGVKNDVGLSTVVNGEVAWRDALQQAESVPHLTVLPAGPPSRRAADGLGETLKTILKEAEQEYDLVICDAPPLLGFAETLQVAALVDGVVVVALAGQTEKNAVATVFTNLNRLKANVLGLVLNEVRADMSERYYYYGYYGKYYSRYYKQLKN